MAQKFERFLGAGLASVCCVPGCLLLSEAPERPSDFGEAVGVGDMSADDGGTDNDVAGDVTEDPTEDNGQPDATGFASLSGNVTRSMEPANGGVGTLYIIVLERNPISSPGTRFLGFTTIANADMSEAEASIEYAIEDIPISSDEYHILAFLDDDNNARTVYPLPEDPDLVAIEGVGGVSLPTVVMDEARAFTLDIVLNLTYPL